MYNQTYWLDHVTEYVDRFKEVTNGDGSITHTPVTGEIIQQGTPQNQTNFNNIEMELQDQHIFNRFMAVFGKALETRVNNIDPEYHTVTLTNTATYPFNTTVDTPVTISLDTTRASTNYIIYTVTADAADGNVGDVVITGRTLNGFKVSYNGSATSVDLVLAVWGSE